MQMTNWRFLCCLLFLYDLVLTNFKSFPLFPPNARIKQFIHISTLFYVIVRFLPLLALLGALGVDAVHVLAKAKVRNVHMPF